MSLNVPLYYPCAPLKSPREQLRPSSRLSFSCVEDMDQEIHVGVDGDDSPSAHGGKGCRLEDRDCPTDSSPEQPSRIFLNVSPSYVGDWDATTAFRELYQNWSVKCSVLSIGY
jgi:hypothetical protein